MDRSWFFKTILLAMLFLLPITGFATTFTEDFESYSVGTDLTGHGWTWNQYPGDTGSLTVSTGKYGKVQVISGYRVGGYTFDSLNYLVDFTVTFDVISYVGKRIFFGFRHSGGYGYWLDCRPNAAFGSTLRRGLTNNPDNAYGLGSNHPPAVLTQVKIVVSGSSIKVYYNGSSTATHDITDSTYKKGTIAVGAMVTDSESAWELDNLLFDIVPNNNYMSSIGIGTKDDNFIKIKSK